MNILWVLPASIFALVFGAWAGSMLLSHTTATIIVAVVLALVIVLVMIIGRVIKPPKSV